MDAVNVSLLSAYPNEDEILVLPPAVFSINKVEMDEHSKVLSVEATQIQNSVEYLTRSRSNMDTLIDSQCASKFPMSIEGAILTTFFEAMQGRGWHKNGNWCQEDVPLREWEGIIMATGRVQTIFLTGNNLAGFFLIIIIFEILQCNFIQG